VHGISAFAQSTDLQMAFLHISIIYVNEKFNVSTKGGTEEEASYYRTAADSWCVPAANCLKHVMQIKLRKIENLLA
jgi:hypothetical protein